MRRMKSLTTLRNILIKNEENIKKGILESGRIITLYDF